MMLIWNEEAPSPRDMDGLTLRIVTYGPGGDESVRSMSDMDVLLKENEPEVRKAAEAGLIWGIGLGPDGRLGLFESGPAPLMARGFAWCRPLEGASRAERLELARIEFRIWADWQAGDTWRLADDIGGTIYEGTRTECLELRACLEAPA